LGGTKAAAGDLISLRRVEAKLPPPPNQPLALFVNGDRLAGKAVSLDEEQLQFRVDDLTPGGQTLTLPVAYLSAIWMKTPRGEPLPADREQDELLLDNGDALRGSLSGLDVVKNRLVFLAVGRDEPLTLEPGRARRMAFNAGLARPLSADGPAARAILRNGSRITFASARLDDNLLVGTTLFDAELRVPLAELLSLDVVGGRAEYLSDRKPSKFEGEAFNGPYAGVAWPVTWAADATADRRRLRLAGGYFDKGIGLRGQSRLTFALDGGYQRFEALVGTDDRSGPAGRARVRLLVDGKPVASGLPADRDLTGREGPVSVSVSVAGAKELTLEVNFGQDGGVLNDDRNLVNWADARLIK
jgi:hypothetical protein